MGQVKHSLFSVLKNEIEKPDIVLIIQGTFDTYFTEILIPYLEHHSFKDSDQPETEDSLLLNLPNGIQVSLKKNIPIVFELRDLSQVSPRFISAVQVINMPEKVDMKDHSYRMRAKLTKLLVLKVNLP